MLTIAGGGGNVMAGRLDGQGTVAVFNAPTGVAVNAMGIIYVAEFWNYGVRMISTTG